MSEQCRVIVHQDGSWETNHPVPGVSLDEAWANLVEHDARYADLTHFDLDVADLPPELAACAVCGEQHSTVDQWVVKDRRLTIDPALPNLTATLRHAILRLDAELNGRADVPTLMRLDRAIKRALDGFALPISDRVTVVRDLEAVLKQAAR
jgi:hypothetical protein